VAGYYFLKEQLNRYDVIGVIGALFGVLVMNINKTDSSKIDTSEKMVIIGIILCAFTTFLGTGVTLSIRLMNKHIHYLMNPSYFAFTLFLMSMVLLAFYPSIYNFSHYTVIDIVWFILSGLIHYTAQTVTSVAYKYEEASKISPLSYTIGIFLFISDIFVFGYKFSLTDIFGV
jgi:drug/metabolite transporter (DMT)-like permease